MKFTKIWTNTGELNFDSDVSIVDISATHRLSKPVSTATLQPNNRYQNDGRLNFYSNSQNGVLNFGVESTATVQPTIVDAIGISSTSIVKSTAILSSIIDLTIGESVSVKGLADAVLIIELSAEHSYPSNVSEHTFTFDINVNRGNSTQISSKFENATGLKSSVYSPFEDNEKFLVKMEHGVIQASGLDREVLSYQSKMIDVDRGITEPVIHGIKIHQNISDNNDTLIKSQTDVLFELQECVYLSPPLLRSSYFLPPRLTQSLQSDWQKAGGVNTDTAAYFENGLPIKSTWLNRFENGINPTLLRPYDPPTIEPEPEPIKSTLEFKKLWDSTGILDFLPIELDALIIMNEIQIYIVDDNGDKIEIHPINASISFDIDSFVWTFSGQLYGSDNLALLTYRAVFEINVNGHQFLFTLREFKKANSFAQDSYSFTCVTNSQWLGQPYATLHTGVVDEVVGAWQLVEEKLATENFMLERTLTPEWTLEADSFSYLNKSAIEIAQQVAEASGAIIQPDSLLDIIHIQPRYKVSPWNWSSLTDEECDHVISADYIDTQSSTDNTTPQINYALISGETHGVITEAIKIGTAGNLRATDVLSSLSQDHNVNAELARNLMGDSGAQEVLGISVPLLTPESSFSLVLPGEIVRVVYAESTITGLCLSNALPLQSITDISQNISLELNNGYD
ncbi:hypothetical protein OW492_00530 [Psychromonas sp. 14N.309.X.WAT.B.A12]|uniref:hypothetical protein n=1 Tax=Psychromonas sp. 14N.309.X.WAT.B.A12 TaxID=2998322 RepID=UPI0025AF1513|nr:hypothetical protein [Psychromonas sp. 14N.309.X.WAT.B.A12]MDN2661857.1 hypothetical protein [Psychromonas sp. 14N.309.X.WAT.B.A12]